MMKEKRIFRLLMIDICPRKHTRHQTVVNTALCLMSVKVSELVDMDVEGDAWFPIVFLMKMTLKHIGTCHLYVMHRTIIVTCVDT